MRTARSRARGIVVLLCATVVSSVARGQNPPQADHVAGGFVTWPWVWLDPTSSPLAPEHRVWTAEDGGRIRFIDTAAGIETIQPAPGHQGIYRDLAFRADGRSGVAVGDDGQYAWTLAGDQPATLWHAEPPIVFPPGSTTTPDLHGLHVSESGPVWVVGSDGLLGQTANLSGYGFVQSFFPFGDPSQQSPPITFYGIDFVDGTTIGAATGDGVIYHTLDGWSWTPATIVYLDPTTGAPVPAPPVHPIRRVAFIPGAPVGYAVGGSDNATGYLFRTDDGGATWRQEFHECAGLAAPDATTCPPLKPCTHPIGPCPPYTAPNETLGFEQAIGLYGVTTFQDGTALAVGYGGQILQRSPLPGQNRWKDLRDGCAFPTWPLWGVHSDGVRSVWATGMMQQIRHSHDQGRTWVEDGWTPGWRLRGIATVAQDGASPGDVAWVVGQELRIARTTDGGASWVEQHSESAYAIAGLTLEAIATWDDGNANPDDNAVVAVGGIDDAGQATILTTPVGGAGCTWSAATVLDPLPKRLRDVAAAAPGGPSGSLEPEFWAVGDGAQIVRSLDAGQTWFREPSPANAQWWGVTLTAPGHGAIVGRLGTVGFAFRFDELPGGVPVWTDIQPPAGLPPLFDVASSGQNLYASGAGGRVFRYDRQIGELVEVARASSLSQVDLRTIGVVGSGPLHQVFAGGKAGELIWFDGVQWSPIPSATSSDLFTLAFAESGGAWSGWLCGFGGAGMGGQSTLVRLR